MIQFAPVIILFFYYQTGRSRGFGFVTYKDPRDAADAIAKLDTSTFMGREIFVQSSKPKDQQTGPPAGGYGGGAAGYGGSGGGGGGGSSDGKLFIGGLAWATTDGSLRAAFERFGEIADVRVIMDRDDPTRSRGFGFVTYASPAAADAAAREMNGADIDGRNVRVDASGKGGGKGGKGGPAPYGGGSGGYGGGGQGGYGGGSYGGSGGGGYNSGGQGGGYGVLPQRTPLPLF